MAEYDEKAVVKLDSDGSVLKCAKGVGADCGYTPGAKVCGKCGAMPVQMKVVEEVIDEEATADESQQDEKMYGKKKRMKMKAREMADSEMMSEDAEDDTEEDMDEESDDEMKGYMKKKPVKMKASEMDDEEDMDEEDMDEEDMDEGDADMSDEEDMDEEEDDMDDDMEAMKRRRLKTMGYKSADVGRMGYMCAIDRKVYPGGQTVCDDCPGGCMPEKGMPGLLHVEGIAEDMFDGKVLDSGYSAEADMFVVDVEAKDGRAIEVFVDGTSAEVLGWHKLDSNAFEQKSLVDEMMLIDFNEAAEIATKSIEGSIVAVEPDVFEGYDVYAVEIDGVDGKSYDVFVSLDGEVLGYDKYEQEDAEDIEAEAAEIALKRAFTPEQRERMAEEGTALPDGSYPISNREDLANAIQAYGRAKDKDKAKRHIMKRARALGAEAMIPANWLMGSKAAESDVQADEKSAEETVDSEFMSRLVEFELLSAEVEENTKTEL